MQAELPGAGHVRGRLDRIAEEHAPRVDPERDQQLELRERCNLEAGTEGVQVAEQRRLGIALHGVVQGNLREGGAQPEVGAFDRVEVEREVRRRVRERVESLGTQRRRVGHGKGVHARPLSRSS